MSAGEAWLEGTLVIRSTGGSPSVRMGATLFMEVEGIEGSLFRETHGFGSSSGRPVADFPSDHRSFASSSPVFELSESFSLGFPDGSVEADSSFP